MSKARKTVEVNLDLGAMKPAIQKAAKASGVSVNEFICNAVESRVRQEKDYHGESFIRHGGKHLAGKHTGYEVTEDGKYYPAPLWVQQFEQLFAERQAIYSLVNSLVTTAQERLVIVEKSLAKAKNDLIDDLGLDQSKNWGYYGGGENCLRETESDQDGGESSLQHKEGE